jgi:hypothetical protein
MLSAPREHERLSWLLAAAWMALILASIPTARRLQLWVTEHLDRRLFLLATLAVLAGGGIVIARALWPRRRAMGVGQGLCLGATAGLMAWLAWSLRANPEESLHVVEYGILGWLLLRACSHRFRDPAVYLLAGALGAVVGTLDECVQWVIPERYWDYRDLLINGGAVALVQILVGFGLRPPFIRPPWQARTLGRALYALAAWLAILWATTWVTPDRVNRWVRARPALAFLDQSMIEYGYCHRDPEIGAFFSRLTVDELRRQDAERGPAVAAALDRNPGRRGYRVFLDAHPSWSDPFAHELRVHLFRRDVYMKRAGTLRDNPARFREELTVGYFENLIAEKYFSNTLHHSSCVLSEASIALAREQARRDRPFISAVSNHLVTRCSARTLQLGLLAAALAAAGAGRYFSVRGRRTS